MNYLELSTVPVWRRQLSRQKIPSHLSAGYNLDMARQLWSENKVADGNSFRFLLLWNNFEPCPLLHGPALWPVLLRLAVDTRDGQRISPSF